MPNFWWFPFKKILLIVCETKLPTWVRKLGPLGGVCGPHVSLMRSLMQALQISILWLQTTTTPQIFLGWLIQAGAFAPPKNLGF